MLDAVLQWEWDRSSFRLSSDTSTARVFGRGFEGELWRCARDLESVADAVQLAAGFDFRISDVVEMVQATLREGGRADASVDLKYLKEAVEGFDAAVRVIDAEGAGIIYLKTESYVVDEEYSRDAILDVHVVVVRRETVQ